MSLQNRPREECGIFASDGAGVRSLFSGDYDRIYHDSDTVFGRSAPYPSEEEIVEIRDHLSYNNLSKAYYNSFKSYEKYLHGYKRLTFRTWRGRKINGKIQISVWTGSVPPTRTVPRD